MISCYGSIAPVYKICADRALHSLGIVGSHILTIRDATLVAPATNVAPACWPCIPRPIHHDGTSPVTFRRREARVSASDVLQPIDEQLLREIPAGWYRFCSAWSADRPAGRKTPRPHACDPAGRSGAGWVSGRSRCKTYGKDGVSPGGRRGDRSA